MTMRSPLLLALLAMLPGALPAQLPRPAPTSDTNPGELAWGRAREAVALTMIRRLDMTSFANSTGPRRLPGKRTLADYGFTKIEGFDDGWADATLADGSWQVGIFVLDDGRARKRLCITETAIGGGTYRRATAIDVVPGQADLWRAVGTVGAVNGCR